jgi:V/A-type H+-transporting ATPase subunit F
MDVVDEYNTMRLPAVIPIPGMNGKLGIGVSNIKKAVEKAVGADILFDNN